VDILGDVLDEPDEQLLIQLSNPSAASLSQALATATIHDDDDPPTLSTADLQVLEGTNRSQAGLTVSLSVPEPEDGQQTPANFTVTLQNPILGETVTVD